MDLQTKLSDATEAVRENPNNSEYRLALIQYFCMCAKWDSALKQIGQFQKLFPSVQKHLIFYLIENIEAEIRRSAVLSTQQKPKTFESHTRNLEILQNQLSIAAYASDNKNGRLSNQYNELTDNVTEKPVKISYFLSDKSEADTSGNWIIDGDVRTAFVYEFFFQGQYYWQTWNSIKGIFFKQPTSLLDIIWRPMEIRLTNGEEIQGVCPARYTVSTEEKWSDTLLSCAETDWSEVSNDLFIGRGQKMFYTDKGDFGILDIQSIKFEV